MRSRRPPRIAVIGVDGSGKTTQARLLAARLRADDARASYFENPGGRPVLDGIARRLGRENGRSLVGARGVVATELVARGVAIARALLLSRLTGRAAVMDRYAFCQYALMGARGDAGVLQVRALLGRFPKPDLVCFLVVAPTTAEARVRERGYDREEVEYLAAFEAAYRALPEFRDFVLVDGTGSVDEVQDRLWRLVRPLVGG